MIIAALALALSTLTCPDYGQAMANEFFMAAPTCNFLGCSDPTLGNIHRYTKAMRDRASRQTDRCIRAVIIDYADYLDRNAISDRARWEDMNRANDLQTKIKK